MKPLTWAMGIGVALAFAGSAYGQCQPRWSDQFQSPYLEGRIDSMVGYDPDGPGGSPARLVVGGQFEFAGDWWDAGEPLNGIGLWDGAGWNALGKGLLSFRDHYGNLQGQVFALATLDEDGDGPNPAYLYAAGYLSPSGVTPCSVARWDGQRWECVTLGELTGHVYYLAVVDEDGPGGAAPFLYAAGNSLSARSPGAPFYSYYGVARFDGAHWEGLSGSNPYGIDSVASLDHDGDGPHPAALFVSMLVESWPDPPRIEVMRWTGDGFETIAPGPPVNPYNPINCLYIFDEDGTGPSEPKLFACGHFSEIGGSPISGIAKWNGHSWERVGDEGDVSGVATAMTLFDDDGDGPIPPALIVTGLTVTGHPYSSNGIARWDGRQWSSVGNGVNVLDAYGVENGLIATIGDGGFDQQQLVVRGSMATNGLGAMVLWNGAEWTPLLGGGLASVYTGGAGGSFPISSCFVVCDSQSGERDRNDLIVGGWFLAAGNLITNSIARWDGRSWYPMGDYFNGEVSTLISHDADGAGSAQAELIAAGQSGHTATGFEIAVWRQKSWGSLGAVYSPDYGWVDAMASFDPDGEGSAQPALVVAGKFTEIDGQQITNVAQWNGIGWSSVGGGLDGDSFRLAVFDEDGDGPDPARLFAGFRPLTNEGITGLGRWNGTSWSTVGDVPIEYVTAMVLADLDGAGPEAESLLVAAWFREEGVPYQGNRLAKWNGKFWSFYPTFYSPYGRIMSIAAMDEDGDGPEPVKIYVSGDVRTSDNYSDNGAAVWDGSNWRALGGGMKSIAGWFTNSIVYDEDGPGGNPPTVIFGGDISSAGDVTSTGIARWGRLAPTIHQHPTNRTVDRGASVQFYVQAGSNDAVSYQWRKNGRPFRDDARVTGSRTDTLRLSHVKLYDAGSYDVVVTNSCGTTESLQAQLTIRGAASIIQAE